MVVKTKSMDIKEFNKVQINYTTRRDKDNGVLDRNVMINIRTDSVEEAFQLYSSLREKLNGQLDPDTHKQTEISYQPAGKICPNCGRVLVRRQAKDGNAFMGCVGYPKCRYTEPMN
jgi:hypothetical protein